MDSFFDVIYCINLKRCADRKEHMIQQFKTIGIKKYQFIEAIDRDDPAVKNAIKSGLVYQSPLCFRCKKLNCNHLNKALTTSQIGNWLSYRKIWKDIIANKYKLALICEDDLVFLDYSQKVITQVLSSSGQKKYGIHLDKPTLIRLGWMKSSEHKLRGEVKVNQVLKMANPCHAINLSMAIKLENSLNIIDCTSDGYIHSKIGERYNHHTVFPPIAYELSFCKDPKFRSEIIPKTSYVEKLLKDFAKTVNNEAKKTLQKIIQKEVSLLHPSRRQQYQHLNLLKNIVPDTPKAPVPATPKAPVPATPKVSVPATPKTPVPATSKISVPATSKISVPATPKTPVPKKTKIVYKRKKNKISLYGKSSKIYK